MGRININWFLLQGKVQQGHCPKNNILMNLVIQELKGLLLFCVASLLNVLSLVDRNTVTFVLGTTSTSLVIVYYAIAIREKLKNKKPKTDVGKAE